MNIKSYLNKLYDHDISYPAFFEGDENSSPFVVGDVVVINEEEIGVVLGKIHTRYEECYTDMSGMQAFEDLRLANISDIKGGELTITPRLKNIVLDHFQEISSMADIVYDTLMKNTQYEQFDTSNVGESWVDRDKGLIFFDYNGVSFKLNIQKIN